MLDGGQIYKCEQCSGSFERARGHDYRYCSRDCFHTSRRGRPKPPKSLVDRTCAWCDSAFQSVKSAGARQRFCSRSCQGYANARQAECLDLTPTDAAYLAAIIDGEGSIMIMDRRDNRPSSTRPSIRIIIGNTYLPLLEWVVEKTGLGKIDTRAMPVGRAIQARKQMHYWNLNSLSARSVLLQVLPYLLEKRDRAERAIQSQAGAVRPSATP